MTNASETALLALLFNNTAMANVGSAAGLQPSSAAGSFYVSLHTADPGETGDQTTSEATYTGYSGTGRQAVARASGAGGWTVSGAQVSNASAIVFGTSSSSQSITNFGIGHAVSAAGTLHFKGASTLSVSAGITPQFAIGALVVTLD
jgi:hypothetical protein